MYRNCTRQRSDRWYETVRKLTDKQLQAAGDNAVKWDGKDEGGNLVGDATYTYRITVVSPTVDIYTSTGKGSIVVEKEAPSVSGLFTSPDPFKLGISGNLNISYNLSENCTVTIQIFKGEVLVRDLVTGQAKNTGYNNATWDGKDNLNSLVGEGVCTIVIKAEDASGMSSEARGEVTAGYQPKISNVSFTPEIFNPIEGSAQINFELSHRQNRQQSHLHV